jgi:GNAT superfamily N-acetyltransferase
MKATRLRLVRPADAAEIVALTSSIDTVSLATPASFRSLLERPASPATERLVVEFDRRLVAWCPSGAHDDGQGWFWIGVDPACRGRGIGSMLFGRLEERLRALGASGLSTQANDDDGRRFLEAGGFRETNVTQVQALELGSACPEPVGVEGVRVLPLAEVDAESLFELYSEARADIPSRSPRHRLSTAEFRREVIDATSLDPDASVVALRGDEPVDSPSSSPIAKAAGRWPR